MKDTLKLALIQLLAALEDDNAVDKISQITETTYEDLVSKYRPLLHTIPALTSKVTTDLLPIVNALYQIPVTANDDPEFQKTRTTLREIRAIQRYEAMKAYRKAGFLRKEAIALVLQDAANAKAALQSVANESVSVKK